MDWVLSVFLSNDALERLSLLCSYWWPTVITKSPTDWCLHCYLLFTLTTCGLWRPVRGKHRKQRCSVEGCVHKQCSLPRCLGCCLVMLMVEHAQGSTWAPGSNMLTQVLGMRTKSWRLQLQQDGKSSVCTPKARFSLSHLLLCSVSVLADLLTALSFCHRAWSKY